MFAVLRTLGKIIDGSGLDQSFIEARIYGPNTVEQIKSGKHMKRSFEGFWTFYVSSYKIDLNDLNDQNLLIEKELREEAITAIASLNDYRNAEKVELIKNMSRSNTSVTKFPRNSKQFWRLTESWSPIFTYENVWVPFTFYLSNTTADVVTALDEFTRVGKVFFCIWYVELRKTNSGLFDWNVFTKP